MRVGINAIINEKKHIEAKIFVSKKYYQYMQINMKKRDNLKNILIQEEVKE